MAVVAARAARAATPPSMFDDVGCGLLGVATPRGGSAAIDAWQRCLGHLPFLDEAAPAHKPIAKLHPSLDRNGLRRSTRGYSRRFRKFRLHNEATTTATRSGGV